MKKNISEPKPKISIIVPVYNVQGYLPKCLNSLIGQTLKDIEIICINDGSTDDSLAILNSFAKKDNRIKVIDQENRGVSAARNTGLKEVSGEYVMFVDSDDWVESETCAECYEKITKYKADLLLFNFQDVFSEEKRKISDNLNKLPENKIFKFQDCSEDFFYVQTGISCKLYRFKKGHKLYESLKKGEDSVYFWEYCLKYNPRISILNKVFYNYLQRADSAMKNEDYIKNCETIKSVNVLADKDYFKSAPIKTQIRILDRFASSLCWQIKHTKAQLDKKYFEQIKFFVDLFPQHDDLKDLRYYPRLNRLSTIWSRNIDLVYSWVDGNDQKWQKSREYWAQRCGVSVNDAGNQDCRFIDNQELRYSLRSVEMFAPWINKIFIVTNGQVPEWLDTSDSKIEIITHDQIMPRDALPTFDSRSIEACLADIPGLSEYFLYANDDFFFSAPLTPDYFFDEDGKPCIKMIRHNWSPHVIQNEAYQSAVIYSKELIHKKFNKDYENLACIHNIIPYRKSMFVACIKEFEKDFNYVRHCKFKQKKTVQRTIITYYMMLKMNIVPKIVNTHAHMHHTEALTISLTNRQEIFNRLAVTQPSLLCINDNEKAKDKDRKNLKYVLAALFPVQQSWERNYGADGSLLKNSFLTKFIQTQHIKKTTKPNSNWFVKKKIIYFCSLPFLKIRRDPNSCRMYLFKIIPLYKITYRKRKTIFKLFNFLPLFEIKSA